MRQRLESVLSVLLTMAAVVIAFTLVYREFISPTSARVVLNSQHAPEVVPGWEAALPAGIRSGRVGAPVTIVVFNDLECPFCARFHESLSTVGIRFTDSVAVVFVHFPLSVHLFARPAARAAECAGMQGRFDQFVDLVYTKQDSLGLKSWTSYAREADVADTASFGACAADTSAVSRMAAGLTVGRQLGVNATPTVLVNGWRLGGVPSEDQLGRVITELLHGRASAESIRAAYEGQ